MKTIQVYEWRSQFKYWHTQKIKVPNGLSKRLCELVALGLVKENDMALEKINWKVTK